MTGCENFQERVEGYQGMFDSLHKDQFNTLLQSKELIFMMNDLAFNLVMNKYMKI